MDKEQGPGSARPSAFPASSAPAAGAGAEADYAQQLNAEPEGWVRERGVRFTLATRNEVRAELDLDQRHLQAYGLVHGGVHCGLVETLASVGAALDASRRGQVVVGLENHTSFIRAARSPQRLVALAVPVTRGRTTQVCEASVRDEQGHLLATGRVRLLCLEGGTPLAGERLGEAGSPPEA